MYKIAFKTTALAICLTGCTGTAKYLYSQPVTYFPTNPTISIPEELKTLIVLHCMKEQEIGFLEDEPKERQCLYVSADAGSLISTLEQRENSVLRDKVITFLTSLSDMNCSNFLQRAFANKSGFDLTKSVISDLSSGVSAGTAYASPAISATLSVSNLIVGKGVDSFNATYYYDKTFQAMESAIAAERFRIKTYITAKQVQGNTPNSKVKYEIVQALSDIRAYDDACSIKAGLAQLIQLADSQKNKDASEHITVKLSEKPVEDARKFLGAPVPK